jgi:hypothetical protein
MMSANDTKGDGLAFVSYVLVKIFIRETAIVRVIMLCRPTRLRQNLFISTFCEKCFLQGKILHEVHVNKVTDVAEKIGSAPNPITCGETCHLGNETRLGRDNLAN